MILYKRSWSCIGLVSFLSALILISLFSFAHAGEFSFHPSIAISEEYTDNVFETRDDKKSDYITHLLPGISFNYTAALLELDLRYAYDYRYYAKGSRSDDSTHDLNFRGTSILIRDLFYLEVRDTYSRVSLDVSRDRTQEGIFVDQTDTNEIYASPYFDFRPGPKTTIRTGYRYRNVWYEEPEGIDRRQHIGFAETTYEYSPRLNLTSSYTFTHENSRDPFERHAPNIGFRYEYRDRSFIMAQGGYTWFSTKLHGDDNSPFWNANITHAMGTYIVSLTTGVSYPDDPQSGATRETHYGLAVTKELRRGSFECSLSYAKYTGNAIDVDRRYGAGVTLRYDLGARVAATLTATIEKYDHTDPNTYTRRIFVNPSLTYPLPKEVFLSLSYVYANYYSPLIYDDNYTLNRVILEARKTF